MYGSKDVDMCSFVGAGEAGAGGVDGVNDVGDEGVRGGNSSGRVSEGVERRLGVLAVVVEEGRGLVAGVVEAVVGLHPEVKSASEAARGNWKCGRWRWTASGGRGLAVAGWRRRPGG